MTALPEAQALVAELRERYSAEPVPPCHVCGGRLSIQRAGGGEATVWGCSPQEDDPDRPGFLRMKDGRRGVDDHYSKSRWTQYRSGDERVLTLIVAFEAQAATIARLQAERDGALTHVCELEIELGINLKRNAELAERAGKPVSALEAIAVKKSRRFK